MSGESILSSVVIFHIISFKLSTVSYCEYDGTWKQYSHCYRMGWLLVFGLYFECSLLGKKKKKNSGGPYCCLICENPAVVAMYSKQSHNTEMNWTEKLINNSLFICKTPCGTQRNHRSTASKNSFIQ